MSKEFWCDKCDDCLVDKDNPITGKFFEQSGNVIDRDNPNEIGGRVRIEWAICAKCLVDGGYWAK